MISDGFILHHYDQSPYAEKIRLLLSVATLPWQSVTCAPMPPRPTQDRLTGGYRRIPIAQCGADLFCDTALIAQEIAVMSNLADDFCAPPEDAGLRELLHRAEGEVFFTAITGAKPHKLLLTLLVGFGPLGMLRFMKDRGAMMKTASVQPPQGKAAAAVFNRYLDDLETRLREKPFLSSDQPAYADFCAYHPLWLRERISPAATASGHPQVSAWYQRISALGNGTRTELSDQQALQVARNSEPRPLPAAASSGSLVGKNVAITPADYGKVAVNGTLVAHTDERLVVARDHPEVGRVHVHFPAKGYDVSVG